jgi:transcriptional regulator
VSAAEKVRVILRTRGESGLREKEIAQLAGTTIKNVQIVKSRLKKSTRERNVGQRLAWLEERVRALEVLSEDPDKRTTQ